MKIGILAILFTAASLGLAQSAPPPEPLTLTTSTLPRAELHHQYYFQLAARGGVPPYNWQVTAGALPDGVDLTPDGLLMGVPSQQGEFTFTVTVTDGARPPHQRSQEFHTRVVTPLLAEWSRPAEVNGRRIEGSIKVSNETERNFNLTFITVAVNEMGRATALGYQHFTLKRETMEMELPFGENLPRGTYKVHVDVVAEVPETNSIYRVHLESKPLAVVEGP
jgi:hypothetical protein